MIKRRLLFPVAVLTLLPSAGSAQAAIPPGLLCTETKKVNCIRDEIFILDGATVSKAASDTKPAETVAVGCTTDSINGKEVPICTGYQYIPAAEFAVDQIHNGGLRSAQWDTIAVFGADFPAPKKPNGSGGGIGPWFFRREGANEIRGTGLKGFGKRGKVSAIGVIAAGSSTNFGTFVVPLRAPPKGLAAWPDPDPAGVEGFGESYPECDEDAYCYSYFQNGYQALAASVGQMYGPGLDKGIDDRLERNPSLTDPDVAPGDVQKRSNLVGQPYGKTKQAGDARIWNSQLDFETSLMGGVHWRPNGDLLIESTFPTPFWNASAPYRGKALARFHPIELYLLGLAPFSDLKPINDYTDPLGSVFLAEEQFKTYGSGFSSAAATFGQLPEVKMRLLEKRSDFANSGMNTVRLTAADRKLDPAAAWLPEFGERDPEFSDAPHIHRMLWVVITKPNDPEQTEKQINYMLRWRRGWNAYYYMLTSYRGRMISTVDAKQDDSPYWEFGLPVDDQKTFVPSGGLQVQFPGELPEPGSSAILSFAHVIETPGETGALAFSPHSNQLPLIIKGDQQHPGALNSFAVRMRLPVDGPKQSAAIMKLDGNVNIRVPSDPASFLIADGQFHTYSADLSKVPEFKNRDFTDFSFVPSTAPAFDVDIDFIRFAWVKPSALGDNDVSCAGAAQPDGFIDTEDNCPNQYNPLQEDADGNGVGDACEDFDQDGTANLCDNCPTLTNSRQRDRDGDGQGDACDKSAGGGCFLQPESVAGGSPRGWALGLLVMSAVVTAAVRRRTGRRRSR
jgi:hypothetical protein